MELTPGEHQLLDHIVAAHQKYSIPLEEAKKFVGIQHTQPALLSHCCQVSWLHPMSKCSFVQLQETASPEESFLHLSETAVVHVQVLVDFTKRLPGEFLPLVNIRGTKSNWWHEPEKNTGFRKRP